jgi:hypothetical protein
MRYFAKLHVCDVMDTVVVSGYVHEYSDFKGEPPEVYEFSYSTPGLGLTEPHTWLLNALYQALVAQEHSPSE